MIARQQNKQFKQRPPTISLMVGRPQKDSSGDFTISVYAIARLSDGGLVNDNQQIVFHADDLVEFAELTGVRERGRADHVFSVPASRAGEDVSITVYAQISNQRCEKSITAKLPKQSEKPPVKKATYKNFFNDFKN